MFSITRWGSAVRPKPELYPSLPAGTPSNCALPCIHSTSSKSNGIITRPLTNQLHQSTSIGPGVRQSCTKAFLLPELLETLTDFRLFVWSTCPLFSLRSDCRQQRLPPTPPNPPPSLPPRTRAACPALSC